MGSWVQGLGMWGYRDLRFMVRRVSGLGFRVYRKAPLWFLFGLLRFFGKGFEYIAQKELHTLEGLGNTSGIHHLQH